MATTRDMAGFAAADELSQYAELDQAFILGRIHPDHGIDQHAAIRGDRHLIVVAGSRAGKGTSLIIPNLLFWQGGVFCIDPKGENASITAMRRGAEQAAKGTGTEVAPGNFLGQKVAILDPYGTVKGPARKYRVSYNPLRDVKADGQESAARILALAEALVIADSGAGEAHFTESAVTLLAGLIEAAIADKDSAKRNLVECREASLGGIDPLKAYLGKALMHDWLIGTFNATAAGLATLAQGRGQLAWEPESSEGYRLTWYAPTGLVCPLARVYAQPDGSFAALIVAGVRADVGEAMAAAEWGIARLTC